jgi:serine/threonine protein kinase
MNANTSSASHNHSHSKTTHTHHRHHNHNHHHHSNPKRHKTIPSTATTTSVASSKNNIPNRKPPPPSIALKKTTTDAPTTTTTVGTCDNVSERYEKVGRVGQGTYGVVYKARDRFYNKKRSSNTNAKDSSNTQNEDEEYVALKRCIPHHESSDGFPVTTLREIHALRVCSQHPNVVSLLHVAVSSSTSSSSAALGGVFLVFEYCPQDLAQLIDAYYPKHKKSPFSEAQVKRLTLQLLSACDYLHSHSLLHRDIKLSNLLYTRHGQLKLADFGLSRHYNDTSGQGPHGGAYASSLTPNVVSLWYRPPELLLGARSTTTTTATTATTTKRLGKTEKRTGIINESPNRVSQPPQTSSSSTTLHSNSKSNSSTKLPSSAEVVTSTITTTTTAYSSKIDLWAVGCVFGELLQGYPLLDGKDELDQVVKMIACLGWPPTLLYPEVSRNPKLVVSLHDSTTTPTATTASTSQQQQLLQQQLPLLDRFQYLSAEGLSLLTKLLDYNPDTRWSAQQALASSYFQQEPFPATHMPSFPSRHNV